MEKYIKSELHGRKPDEVTELTLDNCRATQFAGLTEEFVNLEIVSLINVGLTTLSGFPKLPKLMRLELSDNRLTGGLSLLTNAPNIIHLNLSGNKIDDVAALEPLKDLMHLETLDLFNCAVTCTEGYRQHVFGLIPHLKCLDGFDREDNEAVDSSEDSFEWEEESDDFEDEDEQLDVDFVRSVVSRKLGIANYLADVPICRDDKITGVNAVFDFFPMTVTIDGKTKQGIFMLDTGSTSTYLSDEVFEAFTLQRKEGLEVLLNGRKTRVFNSRRKRSGIDNGMSHASHIGLVFLEETGATFNIFGPGAPLLVLSSMSGSEASEDHSHAKSATLNSAKGNPRPGESGVDLSKKLKPSSAALASINRSCSGLGADYSSAADAEDATDADAKFEEVFKFSVRSIRVGTYRASTVQDFACTRRNITAVVEIDAGTDAGISKSEAVNLSINFSQIKSIHFTCTKQLYALFLDILPDCAEELRKTLGMPASMPNSDRENYFDPTSTHIYHKYFVVILDSLTSEEEATLKSILREFEQQCPELRRSGVIPCRLISYKQANELLRTTLAPHLMKDFETASPAKANRSSATRSTTVTISSTPLNCAEASTSGGRRGSDASSGLSSQAGASRSAAAAAALAEDDISVDTFRGELFDLEYGLIRGFHCDVVQRQHAVWFPKVLAAQTPKDFIVLMIELKEAIPDSILLTDSWSMKAWQFQLRSATRYGQLCELLSKLSCCIDWSKSNDERSCRLCHNDRGEEKMAVCGSCYSNFHLRCLQPPMKRPPKGHWHCEYCELIRLAKDCGDIKYVFYLGSRLIEMHTCRMRRIVQLKNGFADEAVVPVDSFDFCISKRLVQAGDTAVSLELPDSVQITVVPKTPGLAACNESAKTSGCSTPHGSVAAKSESQLLAEKWRKNKAEIADKWQQKYCKREGVSLSAAFKGAVMSLVAPRLLSSTKSYGHPKWQMWSKDLKVSPSTDAADFKKTWSARLTSKAIEVCQTADILYLLGTYFSNKLFSTKSAERKDVLESLVELHANAIEQHSAKEAQKYFEKFCLKFGLSATKENIEPDQVFVEEIRISLASALFMVSLSYAHMMVEVYAQDRCVIDDIKEANMAFDKVEQTLNRLRDKSASKQELQKCFDVFLLCRDERPLNARCPLSLSNVSSRLNQGSPGNFLYFASCAYVSSLCNIDKAFGAKLDHCTAAKFRFGDCDSYADPSEAVLYAEVDFGLSWICVNGKLVEEFAEIVGDEFGVLRSRLVSVQGKRPKKPKKQEQPPMQVRTLVTNGVHSGQPLASQTSLQSDSRTTAAAAPSQQAQASGSSASHMRNKMTPDQRMRKCATFLNTLITLAKKKESEKCADFPNPSSSVTRLVQNLIDDVLSARSFTEELERILKSAPQPHLSGFLEESLTDLRAALLSGEQRIEGIRPPVSFRFANKDDFRVEEIRLVTKLIETGPEDASYMGSNEEKHDIKEFYMLHKGDVNAILLVFPPSDELRVYNIIKDLIATSQVPPFHAFKENAMIRKVDRLAKLVKQQAKESAKSNADSSASISLPKGNTAPQPAHANKVADLAKKKGGKKASVVKTDIIAAASVNCESASATAAAGSVDPIAKLSGEEKLKAELESASNALLKADFEAAFRHYSNALELTQSDSDLTTCEFEWFSLPVLSYAFALASSHVAKLTSQVVKSVLDVLERVAETTTRFPLVYYGKAMIYYKTNEFTKALLELENVATILDNNVPVRSHCWPATKTQIPESDTSVLKEKADDLNRLCRIAPKPTAVCHSSAKDCVECGYTRQAMYLNDLKFSGFIRLTCQSKCKVDWHPDCFKAFLKSSGYSEPRDLEDSTFCFTPDCGSELELIEWFKDGIIKNKTLKLTTGKKAAKQQRQPTGEADARGRKPEVAVANKERVVSGLRNRERCVSMKKSFTNAGQDACESENAASVGSFDIEDDEDSSGGSPLANDLVELQGENLRLKGNQELLEANIAEIQDSFAKLTNERRGLEAELKRHQTDRKKAEENAKWIQDLERDIERWKQKSTQLQIDFRVADRERTQLKRKADELKVSRDDQGRFDTLAATLQEEVDRSTANEVNERARAVEAEVRLLKLKREHEEFNVQLALGRADQHILFTRNRLDWYFENNFHQFEQPCRDHIAQWDAYKLKLGQLWNSFSAAIDSQLNDVEHVGLPLSHLRPVELGALPEDVADLTCPSPFTLIHEASMVVAAAGVNGQMRNAPSFTPQPATFPLFPPPPSIGIPIRPPSGPLSGPPASSFAHPVSAVTMPSTAMPSQHASPVPFFDDHQFYHGSHQNHRGPALAHQSSGVATSAAFSASSQPNLLQPEGRPGSSALASASANRFASSQELPSADAAYSNSLEPKTLQQAAASLHSPFGDVQPRGASGSANDVNSGRAELSQFSTAAATRSASRAISPNNLGNDEKRQQREEIFNRTIAKVKAEIEKHGIFLSDKLIKKKAVALNKKQPFGKQPSEIYTRLVAYFTESASGSGLKHESNAAAALPADSFDNDDCCICLEDLADGQPTTRNVCGHVHHSKCLAEWQKTQQSCPKCRALALPENDYPPLR